MLIICKVLAQCQRYWCKEQLTLQLKIIKIFHKLWVLYKDFFLRKTKNKWQLLLINSCFLASYFTLCHQGFGHLSLCWNISPGLISDCSLPSFKPWIVKDSNHSHPNWVVGVTPWKLSFLWDSLHSSDDKSTTSWKKKLFWSIFGQFWLKGITFIQFFRPLPIGNLAWNTLFASANSRSQVPNLFCHWAKFEGLCHHQTSKELIQCNRRDMIGYFLFWLKQLQEKYGKTDTLSTLAIKHFRYLLPPGTFSPKALGIGDFRHLFSFPCILMPLLDFMDPVQYFMQSKNGWQMTKFLLIIIWS